MAQRYRCKLFYFTGTMVDITTWQCRIGTFSQRAKYQSTVETNKLVISFCFFVSFVVSVDQLVILCIISNLFIPLNFFKKALIIQ